MAKADARNYFTSIQSRFAKMDKLRKKCFSREDTSTKEVSVLDSHKKSKGSGKARAKPGLELDEERGPFEERNAGVGTDDDDEQDKLMGLHYACG
ncbi:hypothetical protein BBJ28_00021586 [Nothophytophthora sp. Chile5]|nr:hypothetical protein BBJ28_00021586 [Nothophytophthora sp. Chile5]